ncbi:non-histone chromosomal protein HMG-14-like [Rattus norvegicus]|uniref:non-histone chromosomal protein HMG-14-like n=1 Tax=Rattus norvegicus TaxID=10116 RepID=UPI0004E4807B|nr:non-histone chromosomal protein HMG-14-like [Rattus norvegicus]|eukprot:XP_008768633.1 PREDICTED: non-histone chromosomal protein HMG-14-like [Rattus norvegicus]
MAAEPPHIRYTKFPSAATGSESVRCSQWGWREQERVVRRRSLEHLEPLAAGPWKTGKDKASDKKVQIKGKRGVKGKQAEMADQQTTDLPAENGETENQSPASEEEKEAKSD